MSRQRQEKQMCGIVGYVGRKEVLPIIINGLRRLEYRGYDSAGVAIMKDGEIQVKKSVGKLEKLEKLVTLEPFEGTVGIGHTRWATHGRPSDINSHPHMDCGGRIALVHNGIIENYMEIKEKLIAGGHTFISDTDTEVMAHLIEKNLENASSLEDAVSVSLREVRGSYALVILCKDEPRKIVAARKESPLVIGLGEGEYFLASDIPAFLAYTRDVMLLNDGEMAVITDEGVRIFGEERKELNRSSFRVLWDSQMAEKSGYKNFMLKEIFEQPNSIKQTLKGLFAGSKIVLDDAKLTKVRINKIKKIYIVACGTAFHAGMIGKYYLEEVAHIPVEIDVASEFRYRDPIISDDTLFVAISQSGETADTLAALKEAGKKGAYLLAITNVVGSSITREVQGVIYTRAGLEIGVAATKTFTVQVAALYVLAHYLAQEKEILTEAEIGTIIERIQKVPALMAEVLKDRKKIKIIASKFQKMRDFLYLGRNINYPVALEGALKLKEISYIHAEGYAAGEMKHGPIALIDRLCPAVVLVTKNFVHEKMLSNVKEVAAREGFVIGIATAGDESVAEYLDHVIFVPETDSLISPLLSVLPLQLLAYYIADKKKLDVDKPRNLAKSVTVE
jgi:glutamine---fructose-6-phosphate transaminase (isomerizing)